MAPTRASTRTAQPGVSAPPILTMMISKHYVQAARRGVWKWWGRGWSNKCLVESVSNELSLMFTVLSTEKSLRLSILKTIWSGVIDSLLSQSFSPLRFISPWNLTDFFFSFSFVLFVFFLSYILVNKFVAKPSWSGLCLVWLNAARLLKLSGIKATTLAWQNGWCLYKFP